MGLPMTEERKDIFLDTLSRTGSMASAATAANPPAKGNCGRPSTSMWYDLIRTDPEFAARVADAKTAALSMVEEELMNRAMSIPQIPIIDKNGNVVAHRPDTYASSKILLRVASRLDPEAWAERRKVDQTTKALGDGEGGQLLLTQSDVMRLPMERRNLLLDILEEIQAARDEGMKEISSG